MLKLKTTQKLYQKILKSQSSFLFLDARDFLIQFPDHCLQFLEISLHILYLPLGFAIDGVIALSLGTVAILHAALTHKDDRRLIRGTEGEEEIEQDERIRIETIHDRDDIDADPESEECREDDDECPASRPFGQSIGRALSDGQRDTRMIIVFFGHNFSSIE